MKAEGVLSVNSVYGNLINNNIRINVIPVIFTNAGKSVAINC